MHSLHPNLQISFTNQLVTLIPGQGEGGNPLARRAAGETTPAPRLLLFSARSGHNAVGPPRVSAGALAPSRAASPILSPLDHPLVGSSSRVYRQSTHARRFPTASHFAPIRDGVVDRELPDCHAPELERSSQSRRILRRTRLRAPRWDVSEVSGTLSEIFMTLAIPEEDHFRRWHHPGRCPGGTGDQQPPQPPGHLIASAAWRPGSLSSSAPSSTRYQHHQTLRYSRTTPKGADRSRRRDVPVLYFLFVISTIALPTTLRALSYRTDDDLRPLSLLWPQEASRSCTACRDFQL